MDSFVFYFKPFILYMLEEGEKLSIGSYIKYGGICAKTKAMYGMRIKKAEFDELISKNSISEVTAFLKDHPLYSEAMINVDEHTVRRSMLESLLKKSINSDFKKLLYFSSDKDKKALKIYMLRSEIEFILRIIIHLKNASSTGKAELMVSMPQFADAQYSANMTNLLSAGSYSELLDLLEKTHYAGALKDFNLESSDPASIETALITHFYKLLFKIIETNLTKNDVKIIKKQLGVKIDIENIRRLIRLKKYFPNVSYKNYILPFGYRLNSSNIDQFAASNDPAETLNSLSPIYSEHFKGAWEMEPNESEDELQLEMDKITLRMGEPSIAVPIAYLSIKAIEIKNLTHIIEGIRYGLSPDENREKLIGMDDINSQ